MIDKINWDVLWMTMAFGISQRSIDPSTKHGCVIVSKNNHIISVGYNSFPKNCIDESLPLNRPEKYSAIIHSEINAIVNSGNKSTKEAIVYVTGHPCPHCFANMINADISKIIYGPIGSHCINNKDIELIKKMNIDPKTLKNKIQIIKYEDIADLTQIENFLDQIKRYIVEKNNRKGTFNG